jgi:hypothetical protein
MEQGTCQTIVAEAYGSSGGGLGPLRVSWIEKTRVPASTAAYLLHPPGRPDEAAALARPGALAKSVPWRLTGMRERRPAARGLHECVASTLRTRVSQARGCRDGRYPRSLHVSTNATASAARGRAPAGRSPGIELAMLPSYVVPNRDARDQGSPGVTRLRLGLVPPLADRTARAGGAVGRTRSGRALAGARPCAQEDGPLETA